MKTTQHYGGGAGAAVGRFGPTLYRIGCPLFLVAAVAGPPVHVVGRSFSSRGGGGGGMSNAILHCAGRSRVLPEAVGS